MLRNIRLYTSDTIWKKILSDLGAICLDSSDLADVNFDALIKPKGISSLELQYLIFNNLDNNNKVIITSIFGEFIEFSPVHKRILISLYKSNGISVDGLKKHLGYSSDTSTNAVDTAIYQLRKTYGKDLIVLKDGKYYIGKL